MNPVSPNPHTTPRTIPPIHPPQAIRETDAPERHQLALRTLPKPTTTTEEDERTLDWQACASWVYDTLLERVYQDRVRRDATGRPIADVSGAWEVEERPSVCRRFEGYLVEGGRLEVQGGPEPGRVAWEEGTLKGGITNLGGYRYIGVCFLGGGCFCGGCGCGCVVVVWLLCGDCC